MNTKAESNSWSFPVKLPTSLLLFLIFSFVSVSTAASLDGPGEVVEPVPDQESDNRPAILTSSGSQLSSRVKRSRDVQQLCGYRLLDALRSVCDRNFVGFTRRSDPSLIIQSSDGQSGEEFDSLAQFPLNLSPWEVLTFELPSTNSQVRDDNPVVSSIPKLDPSTMLDYVELLQQEAPSNLMASPIWPSPYFGRGTGNSSGSKAFALKMLAEPPKTHQRFRRNIIDECCKKPCAMTQMLKYCAITAVGKRSF